MKLWKMGTPKHKCGSGRLGTVCNDWCDELEACVLAKGGHFEYKYDVNCNMKY